MNLRYKIFKWIHDISKSQLKESYLKPNGGCDSCCPRCNYWEHEGNKITTQPLADGSDKRTCERCGYVWLAIFTPAGFIPIEHTNKTNL